jgi:hypothetical protein
VERCLYTEQGWAEAEDALRTAEAVAQSDDERGAAACERGQLAYAATLLGVRDRADEARAALGRAAALIAPGAPGRALLDFRRGLLAENLAQSPQAARAAYRRAHAGAVARSCSPSPGGTWPDSPCGTASWPRRGTGSPNPCGSGRSWGTWWARLRHWPRSRMPRPSRRRLGCGRRRDGCSGCSGVCRRGWRGNSLRLPRRLEVVVWGDCGFVVAGRARAAEPQVSRPRAPEGVPHSSAFTGPGQLLWTCPRRSRAKFPTVVRSSGSWAT